MWWVTRSSFITRTTVPGGDRQVIGTEVSVSLADDDDVSRECH